jgi:hypothetical protein
VDAENLAIDDSSEDQEVEYLATGFPDACVAILLLTLLVEAVDLGDLTGLVITTDQGDLVRISEMLVTCLKHVGEATYLALRHIRRVKVSKLK